MTVETIDLEDVLDDPALQDSYKLANRFGKAVRLHFRGRPVDHHTVISVAATAMQASLRELPVNERQEVLKQTFDNINMMLRLYETILKPAEGTA
jgi:hypothetical protein